MFFPTCKADIVEPCLRAVGLFSQAACLLVMGTCATESDFGKYRRQMFNGPARGIYQMEKPTYDWLVKCLDQKKFLVENEIKQKMLDFMHIYEVPPFEDIEENDALSTFFCRLRYYVAPDELPAADNILGLAKYWKKNYNTVAGKGKTEDFVKKYYQHIAPFIKTKNDENF